MGVTETGLRRAEGEERTDVCPELMVAGAALTERGVFGLEAPFGGKIKSSGQRCYKRSILNPQGYKSVADRRRELEGSQER